MRIKQARQANAVKRFHTRFRHQEETVGHHSANVAMLVLKLSPSINHRVLTAALMHDWPEAYTGDVPAPAKWDNELLESALKDAEEVAWLKLDAEMPTLDPEEKLLLKAADMLDLVLSSWEEMQRGNSTAEELYHNGMDYLADMPMGDQLRSRVAKVIEEVCG